MAISHYELGGSREGTDATDRSSSAELRWNVTGSENTLAIRDYLIVNQVVPGSYDGLVYRRLTWEWLGPENWEFTAAYVHPDKKEVERTLDVGEYVFNFDGTGGSTTRTWSLNTTAYAETGVIAADYKGAINYDGENVNGCDIVIPQLKFSIRKRQPNSVITQAYGKMLCGLTGKVNSKQFLGFAAGELLFLGPSGQQGTQTDPEITYSFSASPNVANLTIGSITGINKKGHQYLWVYYGHSEDANGKRTVKTPLYAFVEDVYEEADFSQLGI